MPNQYQNYESICIYRYKMDSITLQSYLHARDLTVAENEQLNILYAPTWTERLQSALAKISTKVFSSFRRTSLIKS